MSASEVTETVRVAASIPRQLAAALTDKASAAERSVAAEIRLALKAWVEDDETLEASA